MLISFCLLTVISSCKNKSSAKESKEAITTQPSNDQPGSKETNNTLSANPVLTSFHYNPEAGEYKASAKVLGMPDVENLMKNELEIMRNEIFARHGYLFPKKEMREYFENQDWYVGVSADIKDQLTSLEKKNIALILRLEHYADEHGDDFGR